MSLTLLLRSVACYLIDTAAGPFFPYTPPYKHTCIYVITCTKASLVSSFLLVYLLPILSSSFPTLILYCNSFKFCNISFKHIILILG